jgi:hypothetical protein
MECIICIIMIFIYYINKKKISVYSNAEIPQFRELIYANMTFVFVDPKLHYQIRSLVLIHERQVSTSDMCRHNQLIHLRQPSTLIFKVEMRLITITLAHVTLFTWW